MVADSQNHVLRFCLLFNHSGLANPDNLNYFEKLDLLFVAEDTKDGHENDAIWQLELNETADNASRSAPSPGALSRIFSTPFGSEATGVYAYDLDDAFYLVATAQEPYADSDEERLQGPHATGEEAWIGYFGPVSLTGIQPGDVGPLLQSSCMLFMQF